jgi:hypothetical protein
VDLWVLSEGLRDGYSLFCGVQAPELSAFCPHRSPYPATLGPAPEDAAAGETALLALALTPSLPHSLSCADTALPQPCQLPLPSRARTQATQTGPRFQAALSLAPSAHGFARSWRVHTSDKCPRDRTLPPRCCGPCCGLMEEEVTPSCPCQPPPPAPPTPTGHFAVLCNPAGSWQAAPAPCAAEMTRTSAVPPRSPQQVRQARGRSVCRPRPP